MLVYALDENFEMNVYVADYWSDFNGYRVIKINVLRPVEDHAIWRPAGDDQYHAVLKDIQYHHDHEGYVDSYGGFHATSIDGVE